MLRYKKMVEDTMSYLQHIFTTLWTIWNHRNKFFHEGTQPNPMDVILTTHNLFCKYRDAFNKSNISSRGSIGQGTTNQNIGGIWDLIIKISGVRTKKVGRCAYSYEAQNTQDDTVLKGYASSPVGTAYGAVQEALVVAAMKVQICV